MKQKKLFWIVAGLILVAGLFLRLHHIEFGLPHSFHADEPEIAELAIKYTYEIRNILKNKDYYKLIPISYVYGTFPTYLFTVTVMGYSKLLNFTNTQFDKTTIYIFLRQVNAILSLLIIPAGAFLYYKLFKDKFGTLVTIFLLAFNWKLIVHAHYINADIVTTTLLGITFLLAHLYYKSRLDDKHVIILGLIYGFTIGTKITALLTLPLFIYLFLVKKDYRGIFGFLFTICIAYMITNPFSFIFPADVAFRILRMRTKEAGLVFDSVDLNPFKYLISLGFINTPLVFIASLFGNYKALKQKESIHMHIFLGGHVLMYFLFYSLGMRRVDRWLLPILPIIAIYAAYCTSYLKRAVKLPTFIVIATFVGIIYLQYPRLLLQQFQRHTPKSESYLWLKENIPTSANKLAITEEGLDPLNKLEGTRVIRYEVYESEAAQFFMPPSPDGYDYVILASKPMQNFKNPVVRQKYPWYTKAWDEFEAKILDEENFVLIKSFVLPKPNLVNLSDVYVYRSTQSL